MELSISIDTKETSSYQRQISEQIIDLIKTERLRASECLSSSRTLSEQLEVSRNTVKGAYDKLIEQGYIESIIGSGTYVCKTVPDDAIKTKPVSDDDKSFKKNDPVELTTGQEEKLYKRDTIDLRYDFQIERTDPDSLPTETWLRIINHRLGQQEPI